MTSLSLPFYAFLLELMLLTQLKAYEQMNTSEDQRDKKSLLYKGVYAPDVRFNAFVDGVMVNMIAEMKRKRMDPLYFKVYDKGLIEHVPTRNHRSRFEDLSSLVEEDFQPLDFSIQKDTRVTRRVSGHAIGGGVVRGLTKIKRFGNAEVQVAGNMTLVRAHWITGPLDIIIDYRGIPHITRVRTGIQAVQFDTLTVIDRFGAEMAEFQVISPLFDYLPYYGNRTLVQQQTTELVVRHLFSSESFMALLLRDSFEVASYDKIIPQFGMDSTYHSVLKLLFGEQKARTVAPPVNPPSGTHFEGSQEINLLEHL